MNNERKCTDCGAPLPANEPQPVCPACIFRRLANTGSTIHPPERGSVTGSALDSEILRVTDPRSGHDTDFYSEYELLGEIGRGGMGIIYKAHQASLNRIVALKVIHVVSQASEAARRRFQSEVEVAARLNHPNIVPIFDTGVMDGCPCFSMEFFSGGSLAEHINQFATQPDAGVRLLVKVARAVFFAHQHGVLHRDLKPANVLLDAAGEPHVADFGLAKQLDSDSDLTRSGAIIGSPNYMSPEQAAGKSNSLTVATDIYSLGVMLYQLLTGRTPFMADTPLQTMRKVMEEEPAPPSVIRSSRRKEALTEKFEVDQSLLTSAATKRIDRDLETICLKCLEKEPARRYHSAEEFADDLERWLQHEPIHARPTTGVERLQKWARRRPALAALIVALHIAFAFGISGILWQWRKTEFARQSESRQLRRAEAMLTRLELEQADAAFLDNDSRQAIGHLARVLRRDPSNAVAGSRLMSVIERRPFALAVGAPAGFETSISAFSLNADGSRALVGLFNRSARLCDATNGMKELLRMKLPGRMALARFSHDGRHAFIITGEGVVQLWELSRGQLLGQVAVDESAPPTGPDPVFLAEFSPNDQQAATFTRGTGLRRWNIGAAQAGAAEFARLKARAVAMSAGGKWFAVGENDGVVRLWPGASGESPGPTFKLAHAVTALAFDTEAAILAAGDESGAVKFFDLDRGGEVLSLAAHSDAVRHLVFAPDGAVLVSAGGDATLRLWKVAGGTAMGDPLRVAARVHQIEFSPDGRLLLVRPNENFVWVYETARARWHVEPIWEAGAVSEAHFAPDSRHLLLGTRTEVVRNWDVRGGNETMRSLPHEGAVSVLAVSPDGKTLAIAGPEFVRLWNVATGQPAAAPWAAGGQVERLAFSPDGTRLVAQRTDHVLRTWDVNDGRVISSRSNNTLVAWEFLAQPGAQIIFAVADGSVRQQSLEESGPGEELFPTGALIQQAEFSPDCSALAVKRTNGQLSVWNVRTGKRSANLDFRVGLLRFASFSPDGFRGASPSADGSAKVWDAKTGALVLPPLRHKGVVVQAIFSPNGRLLATASRDFEARLWDAQTGRSLTPPLRHRAAVHQVRFSADSKRLVTVARDATMRLWEVESGLPLTDPLPCPRFGEAGALVLTPDGETLATADRDNTVRLWRVPTARGPVPQWLIEMAEALAGYHHDNEGLATAIPPERLSELIRQIQSRPATNDFIRWAKAVLTEGW